MRRHDDSPWPAAADDDAAFAWGVHDHAALAARLRARRSGDGRADESMDRLLALETERRDLRARLARNMEQQKMLVLGQQQQQQQHEATTTAPADINTRSTTAGGLLGISTTTTTKTRGKLRKKQKSDDVDDDDDDEEALVVLASDAESEEFWRDALGRGSWLVGLLIAQSLSSVVLEANTQVIADHPAVVFFLTMLVGAGGNAGNQAAVRVIRSLAVAPQTLSVARTLAREARMAVVLSAAVACVGFGRVWLSGTADVAETAAITASLVAIVQLSILLGAALPFALDRLGAGPSNAATSIQVLMDVAGVLITCTVAAALLGYNTPATLAASSGVGPPEAAAAAPVVRRSPPLPERGAGNPGIDGISSQPALPRRGASASRPPPTQLLAAGLGGGGTPNAPRRPPAS